MHILSWRKVLRPSALEIIGYTIFTIGITIATNVQTLVNQITGIVPISDKGFKKSVGSQLSTIGSNALISHLTIILFWGFIGLAAYTIFWLGLNFVISLKNEVVVEADYVNKARFADRIRVPLEQIVIGGTLLIYVGIGLKLLFPLWISLSHIFFHNITIINPQLILQLVVSLVGSWLTLYLGWTLLKLIFAVRD